jgi:DNA adenine methylase
MRKQPAKIEVYNDMNGEIVNFFRVLRERPDELVRAIDLTPYSREEFLICQEPCKDELERARRTYIWSQQGRGRVGVMEPGGWRQSKTITTRPKTPAEDWKNYSHLYQIVDRLKYVYIEQDDALKILARYDSPAALFYVDPPYMRSTRGRTWASKAYKYEYTDEDHLHLANCLHALTGMVMVSGYRNEDYDVLYGDWKRVDKEVCMENGGRKVTESLWINKAAQGAARQLSF